MPACIVKGCTFSWRQKNPQITLHVFPRDPDMIRKWLLQIFRKEEGLEEFVEKIKNSKKGVFRICSRHFTPNCYDKKKLGKLVFRKDAIPTIFPWLEPYPLEEESADHRYAKKRKLHTELPEECFDDMTPDQMLASSLPSTLTPKEFVMSQFEIQNLTPHTFPEFSTSQNNTVFKTEEVASYTTSNQNIEEVGYYGLPPNSKQKRYYRPRTRRTVGTMTRRYPGMAHKTVQVERPLGMKDKSTQIFRRPPHRSIALQCNLAKLPALPLAGRLQSSELVIHRLEDLHTNPATASFADFVEESMTSQVMEEEDFPMSPELSSIESTMDLQSDIDMEPEETSVPDFDECSSPCVEVEEDNDPEINENPPTDPIEADVSPIFLPETSAIVDHVKERKFIVFESCLNKLLLCCKCLGMANCRGDIKKLKKYRIGSAVVVTAICSLKHEFHLWASQPMIGRMPVGNLLLSSSVLCSGSNFVKIDSFLRLAGILGISQPTHNSNQELYLFPTIDQHWKLEKTSIVREVHSRPVALVGDGLCKLYASRAKCCTYSFLEYHSKKIIDFQVEKIDPSEDTKELEQKTLQKALDRLLSEKLNVRVVCTDRNIHMKRFIQKHYTRIKHQYDVWHVAKSVGNKMAAASREHHCSQLASWIGPAKRHLWWSVRTCEGNSTLLREKWVSLAYHATNQHQWEDGKLYKSCQHYGEEENDDKEWLVAGSKVHCKLKDIVLDQSLLEDLNRLSNFCHTDELEVLHSFTRKYHAKQTRYSVNGMAARSQLAALDYNRNVGQIQSVLKTLAWYRTSDARKDLVKSEIHKLANQDFMKDIIADVLSLAEKGFSGVSCHQ